MEIPVQKQKDYPDREYVILNLIRENGILASNIISFLTSIPKNRLHERLDSLQKYGKIRKVTMKEVTYWTVNGE